MSVIGAAAIAGAASLAGSWYQNRKSGEAADNQMDFQREMSDTSYQRGVKDMRAAGLNPILAAGQGGASTPAGAMPQVENMGMAAVQGATAGASTAQQGSTAKEQAGLLVSQKALTEENIHSVRQQVSNAKTTQALTEKQTEQITAIIAQMQHQTGLLIAQTAQANNNAQLVTLQAESQTYKNIEDKIYSDILQSSQAAQISRFTGVSVKDVLSILTHVFKGR